MKRYTRAELEGREISGKRTPKSKTFDLGNGRKLLRIGRAPLHYRDEDGRLCDCDYSPLIVNNLAIIDKAPYRLSIDTKAPAYLYQSLSGQEASVELVAIGGKPAKGKHALDGVRHVYKNVAKDTDYIITPLGQGVRTDIILKTDKAPRSYKWAVMGDAAIVQPLVGQDANGRRLELIQSIDNGFITCEWTGRAQNRAEARKKQWVTEVDYPVRIDPTVNEEITAGADDAMTSVYTGAASSTVQFLTATFMAAGQRYAAPNTFGRRTAGVRFQSIAIPQGATIDSAVLTLNVATLVGLPQLKVFGNDVDDAAEWGTANRVINLTKTTQNAALAPTATGTGLTVTVTSIVQEIVNRAGFASGNDIAFGIFDTRANLTGGSTTQAAYFEALEAAGTAHATLDITYTEAAEGGGVSSSLDMSLALNL